MWLLCFQGSCEVLVQRRAVCGFPLQVITDMACGESGLEAKYMQEKWKSPRKTTEGEINMR